MRRWQWAQRQQPSRFWSLASPLLALLLTVGLASLLFAALGKSPVQGLQVFFWEPIKNGYAWGELLLKATPLLLIGLGLSLCFRSNVWNIGAEGQFIMGAVAAGAVALMAGPESSRWMVLPVLLAGMAGGMAWGAVVAWLRDHFHANEILVSLMLVYVAEQFLGYMVSGPLKDPDGYGFPLSKLFEAATAVPKLVAGSRVNIGLLLALLGALLLWLYLFRTRGGFAQQVGGMAPAAARYAGFSSRRALWLALLVSGGAAGLAGALEVAGPIGQLTLSLPAGYGFAAIIVAFVGRLHPVGVVFSSILMSMLYIGGELAQSRLGLPKSISLVFQGLLLFTLLACDTLIHSHWRRVGGLVSKGSEEGVRKEAGEEMLAPSAVTAVAPARAALATEGVATGDAAVAAASASARAPASAKGEAHHASHALAPGAASPTATAVATTAPTTPNEQEDTL